MTKKQIIRSITICATLLLLMSYSHVKADTLTSNKDLKVASSIVNVKSVVSIVNSVTKEEKAAIEAKKAEEEKAAAEKAKKEAEEKEAAEKAKAEAEKAKKEAEEKAAAAEKAKKEAEEKEAAEKAKREDEERIAAELEAQKSAKTEKLFGLDDFMFRGVVYWNGYKFTYYSEKVLPGGGLRIPGRHVNADGYVADEEGYIVLAGDAPMGTVFETPFGYKGKIYDRGTSGNHLDVYISR